MTGSTRSEAKLLKADELEYLDIDQVKMIDEALCSINKYGEVRLVVDNNRLRFVVCQISFDAYGYKPGDIRNHGKPQDKAG
jgi:hypothetical protein